MRYLLAMIMGFITALAVIIFLSSPTANWVVYQFKFDSPDQVSNLFDAIFVGLGAIGLIVGWMIGWMLGGAFTSKPDPL